MVKIFRSRTRRYWIDLMGCVFIGTMIVYLILILSLRTTVEKVIRKKYLPFSENRKLYSRSLKSNTTTKGIQTKMIKHGLHLSFYSKRDAFCDGDFVIYGNVYSVVFNISIDPKFGSGRVGGENITYVLKQTEEAEYFTLKEGYFKMQCSTKIPNRFKTRSHLIKWVNALQTSAQKVNFDSIISGWTIAVQRFDYANLFQTMADLYDVFLMVKILDIDLNRLTILWVDGHPKGALDDTWTILFGKVLRAGHLRSVTMFPKMVWNMLGYQSLFTQNVPALPLIEEFRSFFLTRHGLSTLHTKNCSNLSVLFIWRRDYLAHPRNPSGKVTRKISNEDEILANTKELLPGHRVSGLQLDALSMKEQLEAISATDILVGMHGAGLTHAMFLPKSSAFVEILPLYWTRSNFHFKSIANWRKLHYKRLENNIRSNELPDHFTRIDVSALRKIIKEFYRKICD